MAKINPTVSGEIFICLAFHLVCFFDFSSPLVFLFSFHELISFSLFCHYIFLSLSEIWCWVFFPSSGQEEWVLQPPLLLLTTLYFHGLWPNLSLLVSFCDSKASCTLWSFTFCLQNMRVVSLLWENFSCIIFPDSPKFQYHFGWNIFKWFLPKADHQCRKFNPK